VIRRTAFAAPACALAATLLAATPELRLDEIDEVVVAVKVAPPLEDFVEFPKYDSVAISPGGTRLAMGWTDNNFMRQMAIIEFPSMKPVNNYSLPASLSLLDLRWANERRLLIQPQWPVRGFVRRRESLGMIMLSETSGANPVFINAESIATMDPLGVLRRDEEAVAAVRNINPDSGKWPGRNAQGPVRTVLARLDQPDTALFQTTRAYSRSGTGEGYGAFLLNLKDNKQTRVATLPVPGGQFVVGPGQRIALAAGVNAKNETVVYYLPESARAGGRDWQLVVSSGAGERGLRPIGWTGSGEEYYALDGRNGPMRAVVIWNAANNTQRVLYRNPDVDIDNAVLDHTGKPWMFSGSDHFPVYWYPDPNHPLARLHRMLVQRVPREQIEIMNSSDDLSTAVVRVSSGRRPPVYLIVNVNSGSSMTGMFTYPTLRGKRLSQVDPIEFRSRDGLMIRGYLTTPEDGSGKPRRGLPLIVIAHDGPLGEPAESRYEFERQLFASRGYAVLQVNRRGSPGRGVEFQRAGDGKWGRETQEDYADGVRWAIKDGVADKERICFYGAGYGAYSAMVTAQREPDLLKCVIGVSGAYDLPRLLGDGKKEIAPALLQVLGNNMEELKSRSPISFAGLIKAKVMMMPQERDDYFPPEQSNRMRNAFRDAGITVQYEMIGQEYDGLHSPATRANGYTRILRFLDQQIGH
jgi:dienelactone hydrolase